MMYTRENNSLTVRGSELKERGFGSEPVSFSTAGSPVHSTVGLLTFQRLDQVIDSDQHKFQSNKGSVTQADSTNTTPPDYVLSLLQAGRQSRNMFPSLLDVWL